VLVSLRRKILVSVVVTFVVAATILFLTATRVVLGGFEQLEEDTVVTDVKRVEDAVEESLAALEVLSGDWSRWNDTRDFILGKNDTYIEDNLADASFVTIRACFMAFLDLSGRVVHIKHVDLKEGKEVPNSPGFEQVTSSPVLLRHEGPDDIKRGIVMIPEGVFLVAAGPVTNNDADLPVNGTFIVGRRLDEDETEALGARTHLNLSFFRLDQTGIPPDAQQARERLSADTPHAIQVHGPDLIAGYSVIRDVGGKPALILRVEEPRAILRQGLRTARLFTGILFLVGLMTFSILLITVNSAVLRPLARLHAHVERIRDSKDLTTHIEIKSRDELGALAEAFNETTDALRQAQADLDAMHHKLMETSRQAGMADVASGILHNVGNVLNSVNVATATVKRQVREMRIDNLMRAAQLIKENTADLGRFLTEDERGKKLPQYIEGLAKNLKEAQDSLDGRLMELEKHVQHIAEIVSLQQNVARRVGVVEPSDVVEIAEDAIRINAAGLARHGIEVITDFAPVPNLMVDRHQVLQILTNLISNAKYALRDSEQQSKRITLRIEPPAGKCVRVTVADNGIGIEPENLTRIFNHGFTTRSDGHGFGLHTAALAAKQLGGSIAARSEGPGKGAAFVLELPVGESTGESSDA
jgi:sensor domain CHASE-containing protein/nitrogen-specific signal transduction histidine kinase